ncbi:unnamed protein product [Phytophthora fragariaefolia]|uniref:Unnamed protein product n=1 Tax=Phytophthora fragariaefolia TaxID=1490495 RepID=A0A9W6XMA4_9STRA|nr:unnamed protein product [Phytophthora fragariaefolia]
MFVIILPVIQIIAKNWVSRQLTDNDLKPESVIFIVEVFNALYVSNALHNSSSWKTTAMIMAIDFAHFWLSMLDVVEILTEVKALMAKIPRDHPIAKENFVHVALLLMEIEFKLQVSEKNTSATTSKESWVAHIEAWVCSRDVVAERSTSIIKIRDDPINGELLVSSTKTRLFRDRPPQHRQWRVTKSRVSPNIQLTSYQDLNYNVCPTGSLGLETIFSREERALFISRSARVLFISEYIVLIEYAEVVLPIIYCKSYFIHYLKSISVT